jgi:hypothetical protein
VSLLASLLYLALPSIVWAHPTLIPPTLLVTLFKCWSILLLAMWAPAAYVLTFEYPFRGTSNGYFASWVALLASAASAYDTWVPEEPSWINPLVRPRYDLSSDMEDDDGISYSAPGEGIDDANRVSMGAGGSATGVAAADYNEL